MASRTAKKYADDIADHACDTITRDELRERLAEAFDAGRGLSDWIIRNLLNESQLSVIPPGRKRPLRHLINS